MPGMSSAGTITTLDTAAWATRRSYAPGAVRTASAAMSSTRSAGTGRISARPASAPYSQPGSWNRPTACWGTPTASPARSSPGSIWGTRWASPRRILPSRAGICCLPYGVYAAKVWVEETPYTAVTNVGTRPTVGGDHATVESWLLHFTGNLYGRQIRVDFHLPLRPEQKFPSPCRHAGGDPPQCAAGGGLLCRAGEKINTRVVYGRAFLWYNIFKEAQSALS